LSFNAISEVAGTCFFVVFVRSGDGTGELKNPLITLTFTVNPIIRTLDSNTIIVDGDGNWINNGPGGWTFSGLTINTIKSYQPNEEGEFALVKGDNTITGTMYRSTTVRNPGVSTSTNNITYLLIVENGAYNWSTNTFLGNAVQWTVSGAGCTFGPTSLGNNRSQKGSFGLGPNEGKYTTSFTVSSGTITNLIDEIRVNGVPVSLGVATTIGPLTKSKGLRSADPTSSVATTTAPGGLFLSDYAMHIKFKVPATVQITGFGYGASDNTSSLARPIYERDTFASFPRFGAFNAYGNGSVVDGTQLNSMTNFIKATETIVNNLGIPMIETSATLAERLMRTYGMPLDAEAAISFYTSRTPAMTVTDGTAITFSRTYPTNLINSSGRSQSYTHTSLNPIANVATRWPWSGYKKINNSSLNELPSGWFVDPRAAFGLPIIANNNSALPGVIIRESASKRRYVYIDARTNAWVVGGIRADTNGLTNTPFITNSVQFGGTTLENDASTLVTSSLNDIKYTSISWVGSSFSNTSCFDTTNTVARQGFVWSGFYLGGSSVTSTAPMDISATLGKIVWDISKANGETYSSSATYVTGTPNNVLMWTPLAGTNPLDRTTMHVFTLVINNRIGGSVALTNSNIGDWVALYQNGVKLTMSSITSTNIFTQYNNTGTAKMISNILFTNFSNSSVGSPEPFTLAGGAPAANAYATTTGTGTYWSFGENVVQPKMGNSEYTSSEITINTRDLCLKWGIVPRLQVSTNNIAEIDFRGSGWNGNIYVVRMGFFTSVETASAGTEDLAWNKDLGSGKSMLGFLDAADWLSSQTTPNISLNNRGIVNSSIGNTFGFDIGFNVISNNMPAGGFVRLNIKYNGADPQNAPNVRLGITLVHDGMRVFYGLGFSYDSQVKNTAEDAFFDNTGALLAYNGIFRLVRSNVVGGVDAHNAQSGVKSAWSNPYTSMIDSVVVTRSSPLWTAWRSNGTLGDTYTNAISRGSTAMIGTKDNVRKASEIQSSQNRPLPGSFAFLSDVALRSDMVRDPSWIVTFGSWVDGLGNLDITKYGSWVASTFDKSMFKVRTSTAIWTGTTSDVLDLEFRFKSNYACDNTGGAMYHLMYPGRDTTGTFSKATGNVSFMGPNADPRNGVWNVCWGYSSKQPATRICILRQIYNTPWLISGQTIQVSPQGMCQDSTRPMNYIGYNNTQWNSLMGTGGWPFNSIRYNNSNTQITIFGSNTYDGTNEPTDWTPLVTINSSEWLLCENNYDFSKGTIEFSRSQNGFNSGTALWFPFTPSVITQNPSGWQYYKVQGYSAAATCVSASGIGNTTVICNSTIGGAYTFVLGGEPTTALNIGAF
jgi:hypothetical protein